MSEPVVPETYEASPSSHPYPQTLDSNGSSFTELEQQPNNTNLLSQKNDKTEPSSAIEFVTSTDPSQPTKELVSEATLITFIESVEPSTSVISVPPNRTSEEIAAAILAATSSKIHDIQNPDEINSEPTFTAHEEQATYAHTEIATPVESIPIPSKSNPAIPPDTSNFPQTSQTGHTPLPFASPAIYLRNPAASASQSPSALPPAVIATLGSILPALPQYPTEGTGISLTLDIPPPTIQSLTEPITAYSETNPQSLTMTEPQTGELMSETDYHQLLGLRMIRRFLKVRTSYDVLPLSFRLIVLDNNLLIKKSLGILIQNAIVSAPLWDSQTSTFAGLLTATDYINVIKYYCLYPDELGALEQFRLRNLRDIEAAIGVSSIEDVSIHPTKPLYHALRQMLQTRARRIPLVDVDEETGRETVISVITQYRILKFIAVNNEFNTILLRKSLRELGIGTYSDTVTLHMDNSVLDAVGEMVSNNISAIPIVDKNNRVLNVFEAVDIIPCIQGGKYEELSSDIGEALCKRADESPGIYTCSEDDRLDAIFDTIRKSRVHRLVVVDDDGTLKGIVSLSDILKYVLLDGEETDELYSEEEDEEEIKRQYVIYKELNMQPAHK